MCPSRIDTSGKFTCVECQKRITIFQLNRNHLSDKFKCLIKDDSIWDFKDFETLFLNDSPLAKDRLTQAHTFTLNITDKISQIKFNSHFICDNRTINEFKLLTSLIIFIFLAIVLFIYLIYKYFKRVDFSSLICKYFIIVF